jgi:uncharacterized protein
VTRVWDPGEQVLLRSIEADGKVHSARPVTVVADDGHTAALQLVIGTPMMWPEFGDRSDLIRKFAAGEWTFARRTWTDNDVLILLRNGDAYSPQLYRSADGALKFWYVNLQDPVRRTRRGFDTLDHILDVFAGLDLSWWQLKDEHELAEAVELGVLTSERADEIRDVAAHVGALIDGGEAWWAFWSEWEPDRALPIPSLPVDWDVT